MIDYAEALTVIDVNSGSFIGRGKGAGLEDTITKTNLEAAEEVVNQLRLRDIGGIIVIDFIDMARARNRDAVMKTLRKTLDEDRTKTFTAEISKLGLVEMTRQNVTEGVREIMTRPCPTCDGEGVIRSEETIAIEFERRLRDVAAEHPDAEAFLVQINPRVSTQFTGHGSRVLHALEARDRQVVPVRGLRRARARPLRDHLRWARARRSRSARCPFRQGDEVLVEIVEPHMYDVDDAVAKIDGYIISIAGAAPHVGEKRMVRIDQVGPHGRERAAAGRSRRGRASAGPPGRGAGRGARAADVVAAPTRRGARRGRRRREGARAGAPPARRERGRGGAPRSRPERVADDARLRARGGARHAGGARRRVARGDAEARARARGWPTIQASASWPQRRAAPFGCQGEGDAGVAPAAAVAGAPVGPRTRERDRDRHVRDREDRRQAVPRRAGPAAARRAPRGRGGRGRRARADPLSLRGGRVRQGGPREGEGHGEGPRARPRREAAGRSSSSPSAATSAAPATART